MDFFPGHGTIIFNREISIRYKNNIMNKYKCDNGNERAGKGVGGSDGYNNLVKKTNVFKKQVHES